MSTFLTLLFIGSISVGMVFLGYTEFRWIAYIAILAGVPFGTMCSVLAALGKIDRH